MLGTPDNLEENEHCAELKRSSVRARTAARDKQNTDEGECESLAITERPSESPGENIFAPPYPIPFPLPTLW